MSYNSNITFPLLIYLIISSAVISKSQTEDIHLSFENTTEEYGTYLNNIEQDGEFSITMALDSLSSANVEFYYDVFTDINVVTKPDNIQYHEGANARFNGTLEPGDTILVIHKIEKCLIDQIPGLVFKFEKNSTDQASLSLEIEILNNGNNDCGSQISGPNIGFQFLYLIVSIAIFITFWIIVKRKLKPYKDHTEDD